MNTLLPAQPCRPLTRLLRVLLLFWACFTPAAHAAVSLELRQADIAVLQTGQPPAGDVAWKTQALPDLWNLSRPGYGGDVWYRLRFRLPETPREEYAVYLPRLCMNAATYLNGTFLGDGGQLSEPVARNWNRPLFFLVPPSLLHEGENTLLVRVHSPVYSLGSLSTVWVGPASDLRPHYENQFFLRITLNQTATLMIAAMGLFMLMLWWQRRQDTMYGLFGLSSLVWAFNSSNMFLQSVPVPSALWEILVQASFQVFISLLMISLLRFLNLRRPTLEKILWTVLAASPASQLLLPENLLAPASLAWHFVTLVSSVWVGAYLLRAAFRRPQPDTWLLTGALGVNIVFGLHDWLMYASIAEHGDTYWIHYGGPVFFLVVGGILTNRFVQALNQFEQLNADLEKRVQAKHAELESQFATVQNIENQRARLEERHRIYRDLHDDMGAKLLGLAISAQRANLPKEADLARSALQDLRDVVSRSTHSATPLADLLADWRMEAQQRAQAAGVSLEWRFPDREHNLLLTPETALNLTRILREAISNVLRHAQASHLRITTGLAEHAFTLSVEDDGIGLPTEAAPHRGMSSMQARAAALGAEITWHRLERGCRIALRVPLDQLTGEIARHEPAL